MQKKHAKKMAGVFEAVRRVEYMLLQMVEMLLKERTLDCICKKRHAKKMAGVFEAIRRVEYMLWWFHKLHFPSYHRRLA